mgnify:CR=1 FL=1|tara:strand:+ start:557 stop:727 length:171 start_codon:yes stop_codon:yes gene_type:complete
MSKRFTLSIEEDEYGDSLICIPDNICEDLGWSVGDELEYEIDEVNMSITLKKVTDE